MFLLWFKNSLHFAGPSDAIRLRGIKGSNVSGRVEVFYGSEWGTVCDDSWDLKNAMVVCRQLGLGKALKALHGSSVPDGKGKIWLDNVHCTGTEANIAKCKHEKWGIHNCRHHEDAGVECSKGLWSSLHEYC